jgi:hypothetical protein
MRTLDLKLDTSLPTPPPLSSFFPDKFIIKVVEIFISSPFSLFPNPHIEFDLLQLSLDSPGRKKWLCAAQANQAAMSGRRKEVYVLTISSNVQREKKTKQKNKQKRLTNYCRKQKEVDLV